MKIRIDIAGATPVRPDFDMLRASLIAAQEATPTALASADAHRRPSARDALIDVFTGEAERDAIAALRGSFDLGGGAEGPDAGRGER